MEAAVIVLRVPAARNRGVIDNIIWRGAMLQGIKVNKGLESGTWLALCHDGPVELVRPAAADHGLDVSCLRIDCHDG